MRLAGYPHTCAVVFKHDFGIGNSGIDGILDDALNFGPVILCRDQRGKNNDKCQ